MIKEKKGNAQQVYTSLKSSILSLNLVPGTMLSEKDIASRFHVSRTPVREAFIALSKEALLTVIPQKGSMVSRLDFARITQELFLRESLEPAVLKHFLETSTQDDLIKLEKYIDLQIESNDMGKVETFSQYDNMFHQVYFSGQEIALEVLENMCGHYYRIRLLSIWLQDRIKDLIEEHKQLFLAIKKRDTVKALSLLESHIHTIFSEKPILQRDYPNYFVNAETIPQTVNFRGLDINGDLHRR
jgi:DNA-binding GntR family transcriptional regulator